MYIRFSAITLTAANHVFAIALLQGSWGEMINGRRLIFTEHAAAIETITSLAFDILLIQMFHLIITHLPRLK